MRSALLLLLPLACARHETGIDRTVLTGTLRIAAQETAEDEPEQGANDTVESAVDLGYLASRYVRVTGSCLEYGVNLDGELRGDLDHYRFTSLADGTVSLVLTYDSPAAPDTGDTGAEAESVAYQVTVYDLGNLDKEGLPTPLYDEDTTGAHGSYPLDLELEKGGSYAVGIAGRKNSDDLDSAYTLLFSGFDPNETRFLVGAWQESSFEERGDPVGGTSVDTFTLDESTLSWTGSFQILDIRAVVREEDTGAAEGDAAVRYVLDEEIPTVWLWAGTIESLNSSPLAGDMYSAEMVRVDLATGEQTWDERGGYEVVVDSVQPVLYGWSYPEEEPNDLALDAETGALIPPLDDANDPPVGSGLGYIDTITGNLTYTADDPKYADDVDVFAVSVPETANTTFTASWEDATANLDILLFDADGALVWAGYFDGDVLPEVLSTESAGFALEAGATYYVALLPWTGTAGDKAYTVEIAYTQP